MKYLPESPNSDTIGSFLHVPCTILILQPSQDVVYSPVCLHRTTGPYKGVYPPQYLPLYSISVGPNTASERAKNREDLRPSLAVLLIYIMEQ
jgi:hypothetical protein